MARRPVVRAVWIAWFAASGSAAQSMPPAQQNALVQKYCAVCHTDETRNGGLSLAHYDAAQANPALAAMLLSKLQNNAMGAAGLGLPDKPTRDAWVAATTAQAVGAAKWTVIRTGSVVTASTVRDVALRAPAVGAPVYRLTLACDLASRQGDIELTWAPVPQTGRTFFASVDGNAGIPHVLEGREEKMGNGAAVTTGLAMSTLNVPLPEKTLTIENLFPGETVVFPLSQLNPADRRELAVCLAIRAFESTGKSR